MRATVVNGPTIACVTPCTHLVTAGVSNWGGYGLAASLAVLAGPAHPHASAFIPSREEEAALFAAIADGEARCGTATALWVVSASLHGLCCVQGWHHWRAWAYCGWPQQRRAFRCAGRAARNCIVRFVTKLGLGTFCTLTHARTRAHTNMSSMCSAKGGHHTGMAERKRAPSNTARNAAVRAACMSLALACPAAAVRRARTSMPAFRTASTASTLAGSGSSGGAG